MIALPLLLQLATVGDTIWVHRMVAVQHGLEARPAEWEPTGDVELLGRPRVSQHGDSVEIAYPLTVWVPGQHTLRVPGPLLVASDGRTDSLPAEIVTVIAASVLPPVPADSTLRPQPITPTVPSGEVSPIPLLILLAAVGLLVAPSHWLWRRRGKPVPVPDASDSPIPPAPVHRWVDAGEARAVVGAAVERLRTAIAEQVPEAHPGLETEACLAELAERRPDWPVREIGDLLRALDEARFAQGAQIDAAGLYQWTEDLEARLPRAA